CHLARGGTAEVIGRKVTKVRELYGFQPAVDAEAIRAKVLHVDSYGNLLINVTRKLFNEVSKGRTYSILFGQSKESISTIHKTYGDVLPDKTVDFFSTNELLQIAVNKGADGVGSSASTLLGAKTGDPVLVEFGAWPRSEQK